MTHPARSWARLVLPVLQNQGVYFRIEQLQFGLPTGKHSKREEMRVFPFSTAGTDCSRPTCSARWGAAVVTPSRDTESHPRDSGGVRLLAQLCWLCSSHQPHFLDLSPPADFPSCPSLPWPINTRNLPQAQSGPAACREQIAADKGPGHIVFFQFTFKSENCLLKEKEMCLCVLGGSGRRGGRGRELLQRPNWGAREGGLMEIDEGS